MADSTSLFIEQRAADMQRISEAEKNNRRVRFENWKRIYIKKYGDRVSFGGNEAILTKPDGTQEVIGNYKTDKKKTLQENKKPVLNKEQLTINKRLDEIAKADQQRLDDAYKAENQEIRDTIKLQDEANPNSYDALARQFGWEIGRTDAQFTKGGGYNLTIPKNIPSDKQDPKVDQKGGLLISEQKEDKKNPAATGSFDKKLTKIYGKRKMKRFNQVYGKLNLSDRMKRHLLMTKAFRDM